MELILTVTLKVGFLQFGYLHVLELSRRGTLGDESQSGMHPEPAGQPLEVTITHQFVLRDAPATVSTEAAANEIKAFYLSLWMFLEGWVFLVCCVIRVSIWIGKVVGMRRINIFREEAILGPSYFEKRFSEIIVLLTMQNIWLTLLSRRWQDHQGRWMAFRSSFFSENLFGGTESSETLFDKSQCTYATRNLVMDVKMSEGNVVRLFLFIVLQQTRNIKDFSVAAFSCLNWRTPFHHSCVGESLSKKRERERQPILRHVQVQIFMFAKTNLCLMIGGSVNLFWQEVRESSLLIRW